MSDNAGGGGGGDNWVLGVTLGILGSVAINVGNNIVSVLGLRVSLAHCSNLFYSAPTR